VLRKRSLIAILCIAALLAAAMTPLPSGSVYAVLVPLTLRFAFSDAAPFVSAEPADLYSFLPSVSLSSRGPPSA
jgi:hypothetical protein